MNSFKSIYFTCSALLITVVSFSIITNSCTDQKFVSRPTSAAQSPSTSQVESSSSIAQPSFDKTVGKPIDRQTGLHWIQNFKNNNSTLAGTDHIIQARTLKEILSNNSCVGVSLFYAVDNSGKLLILPVGVNSSGKIITAQFISGPSSNIEWQTAWQWINNYTGKIKSHFFGNDTYNRLLIDQNSPSIRISLALDDSGNAQLLMSNAASADPTSYEDESMPCPPYCPTTN